MADRPPRRLRRLLPAALIGLGIVVAAAVALWLALPMILGRVVVERLAEMGVPAPRLVVSHVGIGRATAVAVRAGTADELTAREIVVHYRLPDLLDGSIDGITIREPTLRASLDADGISLGNLDGLLTGGGDGRPFSFPPVQLEDATVDLATALGPVILTGGGTVTSTDGAINADLDLAADAPQGSARGVLNIGIAGSSIETRFVLADGRIVLPDLLSVTARGEITARLADGEIAALDGSVAIAELLVSDSRAASLGPLAGTASFGRKADGWRAAVSLADAANSLDMRLRLAAPALGLAEKVTAAVELDAGATAPIWPLAGLASPRAGAVSARLVAEATPEALLTAFSEDRLPELDGSIAVDLDGAAVDGAFRSVSMTGGFDVKMRGDTVRLTAAAPILAEIRLDPALLDGTGLPPPAIELLAQPLATTMHLPEPLQLRRDGEISAATVSLSVDLPDGHRLLDAGGGLRMAGDDTTGPKAELSSLNLRLDLPDGAGLVAGTVTAGGNAVLGTDGGTAELNVAAAAPSVDAGGLRASGLKLNLPLAIAYGGGRLIARLTAKGEISAARLEGVTPLRLDGPVQLPFIPADIPSLAMNLSDPDNPRATIDLAAGPLRLAGTLAAEHGAVESELSLPRLQLRADLDAAGWTGELTAKGGSLGIPTYAVAATDLELAAELPQDGAPRLSLHAAVAHRGEPALVIPLSASLTARQAKGGWAFTGHAADAFERISIDIEGRHDLSRNTGTATLRVAPIDFAPNVRQPEDLAPFLAGVAEEVSGTIALAGNLSWDAEGIGSDLELLLRDVSATTDAATIDRLNGVIAVDGLLPFSTPPGQRVAVAAIDAGLPLTDGLLTFRVAPGPKLEIADGRLHLAGGTVELEPLVFDPSGASNEAALAVSGVELGELLALAQVDGLTGTGKLTGQIPVRLVAGDVVIEDGRLEAEGPGRLSYAPLVPPAALQGQGETVSLALSALTDFQYQQLRLTVDRQAGGEMLVGMHVRGSNPDFYDGYPVEFNLTVSGALDRVLRQSLAGYRIPDAIEERLEEFAQ